MNFDKRQIQTAVQGGPDSDDPVICPTDADELDVFRAKTCGTTFWCGRLLGGCGGQLSTRKYVDRVSHFAHLPDPQGLLPQCGRRSHSSGVSSADHLFVKSATQSWFRSQGHTPRYRFIDHDDAPVGSVVDIEVDGRRLRVHMNPDVPLQWDSQDVQELVLGPGVPSSPLWPMGWRYVNRAAFRTVGGRRVMQVGTETPHGGTEWFAPSECEVTPDGLLITPAVKQILQTRSDIPEPSTTAMETETKAAPAPLDRHVPDQIANLIRGMNAAKTAGHVATARELRRDAECKLSACEGYALYVLRSALTKTDEWLSVHDRNRRVLFIRLKAAQQDGNALAARDLLKKAKKVFERDLAPNGIEAAILTASEELVASKLPEPTPRQRAMHRIPLPSRPLQLPVQQVAPTWQQVVTTQAKSQDQQHAREEFQERRRAKARARSALGALRATRTHPLPSEEEERLITELSTAMESAGALLSTRDRRDAEKWIKRVPPQERTATDSSVSSEREGQGIAQPHLPSDLLTRTADAVRGALKKKAREQSTTSWAELRQRLGSALPHMDIADRVEVLVLVDRKTPTDQAPLSSLVAQADPIMTSHYREILAALGLAAPADDDDLRDVLEADVEQLHRYWRHQ